MKSISRILTIVSSLIIAFATGPLSAHEKPEAQSQSASSQTLTKKVRTIAIIGSCILFLPSFILGSLLVRSERVRTSFFPDAEINKTRPALLMVGCFGISVVAAGVLLLIERLEKADQHTQE
jgi:hypothetical protein